MSIEIKQSCDGCGAERFLGEGSHGEQLNIEVAMGRGEGGGWKEVEPGKHLCRNCVKKVLSGILRT